MLPEIERLSEGSIIARRNRLIGTWAGMRLGFRGDRLSHLSNKVDLPPDLIVLELERIERNLRENQLV